MWCEAAWDDANGGCKRQPSGKGKGSAPLCSVKRTNQATPEPLPQPQP